MPYVIPLGYIERVMRKTVNFVEKNKTLKDLVRELLYLLYFRHSFR